MRLQIALLSLLLAGAGAALAQSAGSLDTAFDPGAGANNVVNVVRQQPSDRKILVGGVFTTMGGQPRAGAARLDAAGALDTAFVPGVGGYVNTYSFISGGKIAVGGINLTDTGTSALLGGMAILNADGTRDTSFSNLNPGMNGFSTIIEQTDGKFLVGGAFSQSLFYPDALALLNADGSVISGFPADHIGGGGINTIIVQPDGKLLISGSFDSVGGVARVRIARLNSDGSLDASFDPGTSASAGSITTPYIQTIVRQGDGKILVGGQFNSFNGVNAGGIIRLNANGSVDTSFHSAVGTTWTPLPGITVLGPVWSIALQDDGKILIAGSFNTYNGTNRGNVARLNADGTLDTSFDPGVGADSAISSITFQSDGKLLAGGYFGKYNNTTRNKLARVFVGASSGGGGSLKLLAPNGGESLATGSTSAIQWEAPAAAETFDLQYSIDNGTTWKPVATGVTGTSYDWDVPLMPGNKTKAKVRITAYNGSHSRTGTDVSDGPFAIEVVHLGAPDGGETWHSGSTATITWETNATVRPVASVKVQYTRDGGTTWKVAGTASGNPGTLDWTVPAVPAAKPRCKVKVILLDSAGLSVGKDLGDDWFTIAP